MPNDMPQSPCLSAFLNPLEHFLLNFSKLRKAILSASVVPTLQKPSLNSSMTNFTEMNL